MWYMSPVQCEELRIKHLTLLLILTMPYACWFLCRAKYIEDFKWRRHFQFGVAFWRDKSHLKGTEDFNLEHCLERTHSDRTSWIALVVNAEWFLEFIFNLIDRTLKSNSQIISRIHHACILYHANVCGEVCNVKIVPLPCWEEYKTFVNNHRNDSLLMRLDPLHTRAKGSDDVIVRVINAHSKAVPIV